MVVHWVKTKFGGKKEKDKIKVLRRYTAELKVGKPTVDSNSGAEAAFTVGMVGVCVEWSGYWVKDAGCDMASE